MTTKPPPGEGHLLPAPAREHDPVRALLCTIERKPERVIRGERRQRVLGEMALVESEAEYQFGAADLEAPPAVGPLDGAGVEVAHVEVVAKVGSSSVVPAGTTATPPGGSASTASALARTTFSSVPTSSRCSGPSCVTSVTSGRATAASSAIWPSPRIPSSTTSTSVSGSSRSTVSGSPISLFWLWSGKTVGTTAAQSAPRMSLVVVFPVEPTTATTRADERARTSDASAASAAC